MTLTTLFLEIPGPPIPLKRHRSCTRRWGMNKASGTAAFRTWQYNPQAKLMQDIKALFRIQYPFAPIDEPLEVCYAFYLPIPKTFSKISRKDAIQGKLTHFKKPDCSNLIKFYEDCMNEVIYVDDSQIIKTQAIKFYSENPKTQIWVRSLSPEESTKLIFEIAEKCA